MAYMKTISKGWPDNIIASIWPGYYLYDIDTQAVIDAVKALPARQREIAEMRYRDEITQKKIAELENISEARVGQINRSLLLRVRKQVESGGKIRPKPQEIRDEITSAENLKGNAFRYGGLGRNFGITLGDLTGSMIDYDKCPCCGKPFDRKQHPYAGSFCVSDNPALYRLKIICRDCAYSISPFVIESDGMKRKGIGRKRAIGLKK